MHPSFDDLSNALPEPGPAFGVPVEGLGEVIVVVLILIYLGRSFGAGRNNLGGGRNLGGVVVVVDKSRVCKVLQMLLNRSLFKLYSV